MGLCCTATATPAPPTATADSPGSEHPTHPPPHAGSPLGLRARSAASQPTLDEGSRPSSTRSATSADSHRRRHGEQWAAAAAPCPDASTVATVHPFTQPPRDSPTLHDTLRDTLRDSPDPPRGASRRQSPGSTAQRPATAPASCSALSRSAPGMCTRWGACCGSCCGSCCAGGADRPARWLGGTAAAAAGPAAACAAATAAAAAGSMGCCRLAASAARAAGFHSHAKTCAGQPGSRGTSWAVAAGASSLPRPHQPRQQRPRPHLRCAAHHKQRHCVVADAGEEVHNGLAHRPARTPLGPSRTSQAQLGAGRGGSGREGGGRVNACEGTGWRADWHASVGRRAVGGCGGRGRVRRGDETEWRAAPGRGPSPCACAP
jgi:hypothetical protein